MQPLLEKDPESLNIVDEEGVTARWYALGYLDGLALLLKQPSINVNHRTRLGFGDAQESPPFNALDDGLGPYEICSLLVKHPDTNLSGANDNYGTPLMSAIRGDQEELVRDILERGWL
jgi:hypothetical protein